jgi:hypothetical protein
MGDAFKDLSRDSRIGSSAAGIDSLAKKLTSLGKSAQVAGGAGTVFGGMAEGLGMLLSPTALGSAAVGLLAKGMWDLNKVMTDNDALMERQAQLSGMNATNLWAWGEAAKTVGANPGDITGGISSVQTAIAGMMVGATDATPQLVALARLGLSYDPKSGLTDDQVTQMFSKVHGMAAASGYKNLGALRALTGPIMNDAMFNIAASPEFDPGKLQKQIADSAPESLNATFQNSLKSQMALGQVDIDKDILAQTAYGGEQGLMSAAVTILRDILVGVNKLASRVVHPIDTAKKIYNGAVDAVSRGIDGVKDLVIPPARRDKMSSAMKTLMGFGVSEPNAAAMVGSMDEESWQLSKGRQAAFAKRFGYQIGSSTVSPEQQLNDQLRFVMETTQKITWDAMEKARDLMGKASAFRRLEEHRGDDASLGKAFSSALDADRLATLAGMVSTNYHSNQVQHNVSSETNIGDIIINTPSTDPRAHAAAVRLGLADQPLLDLSSQGFAALSTRGMTQ